MAYSLTKSFHLFISLFFSIQLIICFSVVLHHYLSLFSSRSFSPVFLTCHCFLDILASFMRSRYPNHCNILLCTILYMSVSLNSSYNYFFVCLFCLPSVSFHRFSSSFALPYFDFIFISFCEWPFVTTVQQYSFLYSFLYCSVPQHICCFLPI